MPPCERYLFAPIFSTNSYFYSKNVLVSKEHKVISAYVMPRRDRRSITKVLDMSPTFTVEFGRSCPQADWLLLKNLQVFQYESLVPFYGFIST